MFIFTLSFGEIIQFDQFFFWMGWNHQLDKTMPKKETIIKPLVSRSDKTLVGKDALSAWNQEKECTLLP